MSRSPHQKIILSLFRSLLECGRKFDRFPASKALLELQIHKNPTNELALINKEILDVVGVAVPLRPILMSAEAMSESFEQRIRTAFRRPIEYYVDFLSCGESEALQKCIQADFEVLKLLQTHIEKAERIGLTSGESQPESDRTVENVEPTHTLEVGSFLLAHPMMPAQWFKQSVILITDMSKSGIRGYMVNKPVSRKIISGVELKRDPENPSPDDGTTDQIELPQYIHRDDIYFGGPIPQTLILQKFSKDGKSSNIDLREPNVIFKSSMVKLAAKFVDEKMYDRIIENIDHSFLRNYIEEDDAVISKEASGNVAADYPNERGEVRSDYKMILGTVSWFPGQLELEIEHGFWTIASAPVHIAEGARVSLWQRMLCSMGGTYAEMAKLYRLDLNGDD